MYIWSFPVLSSIAELGEISGKCNARDGYGILYKLASVLLDLVSEVNDIFYSGTQPWPAREILQSRTLLLRGPG